MELWQRNHINENMRELIRLTQCTTSLKTRLLSNKILSEEDLVLLETRKNAGPFNETHFLYTLLLTKTGGYGAIVQALDEGRQTGAWKVLTEEVNRYLLDSRVKFWDNITTLRELLPTFTEDDAKMILLETACQQEFISQHSWLEITPCLPPPRHLYVPRKISNRLKLDPSVFSLESKDVFVFSGLTRFELAELVKPHPICSSKNVSLELPCRHIHLVEQDDWEDLIDWIVAPLHFVVKEGSIFILQKTTRATELVLRHGVKERGADAYISQERFIDQLSDNSSSRTICVCDAPGMGKTWFLEHIARTLQGRSIPGPFVFFITLPEFSTYISEVAFTADIAFKMLLEFVYNASLQVAILLHMEKLVGCRFVIFFDGFDEVPSDRIEKVSNYFTDLLSSSKNVKICISSRPHMRDHLEKTFKAVSYDVLPFDRHDQIAAISNVWKQKHAECDEQLLKEFAAECIKATFSLVEADRHDILGIPLKCFLLAGINEDTAIRFADPTRQHRKMVPMTLLQTSVCTLFEKYVESTLNSKVFNSTDDLNEETKQTVLSLHTFKALQLLFPDLAEKYPEIAVLHNESARQKVTSMGILIYSNKSYEFVHRSFAEYFAGKYFADHWNNKGLLTGNENDTIVAQYFCKYLLQVIDNSWIKICDKHSSYQMEILTFKFHHGTILLITNILLQNATANANESRQDLVPLLRDHFHSILLSCIDSGFTKIMRLVCDIIQAALTPHEIVQLTLSPDCNTKLTSNNVQATSEGLPRRSHRLIRDDDMLSISTGSDNSSSSSTSSKSSKEEYSPTSDEAMSESSEENESIETYEDDMLQDSFSLVGGTDDDFEMEDEQEDNLLEENTTPPSTDQDMPLYVNAARILSLIYYVAEKGSLSETLQLLRLPPFSTEGYFNSMLETYSNLPSLWKILIRRNDMDLVVQYLNLIPIQPRYLLQECIYMKGNITKLELESRFEVCDTLIQKEPKIMVDCVLDQKEDYWLEFNFDVMKHIAKNYNFDWKSTPDHFREALLTGRLRYGNDQQFIDALLMFFPKNPSVDNHFCLASIMPIANEVSQCTTSVEVFVEKFKDMIDIDKVKRFYRSKHLLQQDCNARFYGSLNSIFIVELLTQLFGDMTRLSLENRSLLHAAVNHRKTTWVEYLLKKKFDVNCQDADGETPLHYMNWTGDCQEITKLLIDYGANVYATNWCGDTVAHQLVDEDSHDLRLQTYYTSWIRFMFERGYYKIWLTPNHKQQTPLDILATTEEVENESRLLIISLLLQNIHDKK